MNIIKIKQKFSLDPKYLTYSLKNHLFNKIKSQMEGTCVKEHGYILNVLKLSSICDNNISLINSHPIFDVVYEASVLKPVLNQVLTGTVCLLFSGGIFVNVHDKMKVLIPSTTMDLLEYNGENFVSKISPKDIIISKNMEISTKITQIKYEQKQFRCIGVLNT